MFDIYHLKFQIIKCCILTLTSVQLFIFYSNAILQQVVAPPSCVVIFSSPWDNVTLTKFEPWVLKPRPLQLDTSLFTIYSKCINIDSVCALHKFDTALPRDLSYKPAKCEADRTNSSLDFQHTDRQTKSLLCRYVSEIQLREPFVFKVNW